MTEIEVTVDGMEMIASQVVHLASPTFRMKISNMPIEVEFLKDDGSTRYKVSGEEELLSIKCFNFSSKSGSGKLAPVRVGSNKTFQLFMTFFVQTYRVEADERVCTFNFYKRVLADE